jgi:hypothetical protein
VKIRPCTNTWSAWVSGIPADYPLMTTAARRGCGISNRPPGRLFHSQIEGTRPLVTKLTRLHFP